MMHFKSATRVLSAAIFTIVAMLGSTTSSFAFSTGITTGSFPDPATACNFCHTGGTPPLVALTGPASVAAGSTNEYTLTVTDLSLLLDQDFAGLNVSAPDGTLAVGGSDSANTQLLSGEITHTAPKAQGVPPEVVFTFEWTAPLAFTSVTLEGWGNAVNFNSNAGGDRASMSSLVIFNSAIDTPTATATPTATETPTATATGTPAGGCSTDVAPLNPSLVSDKDAQNCQKTIGKASGLYLKKKHKAVQKCLNALQKGTLSGDPVTLCRGTSTLGVHTPPTDAKTAAKIAKAEDKLRQLIDKKCTDGIVASLDSCATTVTDLKDCLVDDHWQAVDSLIQLEYGDLAQTPDSGEQKCQKTIGNEGGKYATKSLKLMQKCLDARNKDGIVGDAAALCLGSVVSSSYVPPTDTKTAEKIAKLETKLIDKIGLKCTAPQLAALDSCGTTPTVEADCLLCSHREIVFTAVETQYGGN